MTYTKRLCAAFLALIISLSLVSPKRIFAEEIIPTSSFEEENGQIEEDASQSDEKAKITLPKSIKYVAPDAFLNSGDIVIYGFPGSYAETYAAETGVPFVSVEISDISLSSPEWAAPGEEIEFVFSCTSQVPVLYRLTIEKDGSEVHQTDYTDQSLFSYAFPEDGMYSLKLEAKNDWTNSEIYLENAIEIVPPIQLIRPFWQVGLMDTFYITDENETREITLTASDPEALFIEDESVTALKLGNYTVTASLKTEKGVISTVVPIEVIIPVEAIEIHLESDTIPENGQMLVTCTVTPENADYPAVTWDTDNHEIATIDENGLLTAHSQGDVIITAVNPHAEASASLRVTRNVSSVSIETAAVPIPFYTGMTAQLTAVCTPPEADDQTVAWESKSTDIATVDPAAGVVAAISPGEAVITATANDPGKAAGEITITVVQGAEEIIISSLPDVMKVSDTFQIEYTVLPEEAASIPVSFSADDPSIVSIDDNGLVTFLKNGECTITATSANGVSASFTAMAAIPETRIDALLPDVYLNPDMTASPIGSFVFIKPDNATFQTLSWSSSNSSVAKVDSETGVITAVSNGNASITGVSHFGLETSFTVHVVSDAKVIQSQSVSPTYLVMSKNDTATLTPSCSPVTKYAAGTWYSDNTDVCVITSVTSNIPTIKAVGPGSANVYAIATSGVTAVCRVHVNPVVITSLSLSASSLSLNTGDSFTLTAVYSPANADASKITWSSSNDSVAIVDETGLVTAVGGGSAIVTAASEDGLTARCIITVKAIKMTSASLLEDAITGNAGDEYEIQYTFEPSDATPASFYWKSEDISVADVGFTSGKVTLISEGSTFITGEAADGSGLTFRIPVTVSETPITKFTLNASELNLSYDETFRIEYTISPEGASWATPTFESADPGVASVSSDGVIRAVSKGNTVIYATAGHGDYQITNEIAVTVTSDSVTTYRALSVGQFAVTGETGFLPFSVNSTKGVADAFRQSVIDGNRYSVRHLPNNPSPSAFRSALSTLASQADSNDVTVVFFLTHGAYANNSYYAETSSGQKIMPQELINALKEISGDVVLILCTCQSGRILSSSAVTTLMSAGGTYTGNNGSGRLSILCSSTNTISSYYNTSDTYASYDFFSLALTKALGWDMLGDTSLGSLPADTNGDHRITLSELSRYSRTNTQRLISAFIQMHGTSQFSGHTSQYPSWSFASGAGDLVLFGK
ncbi:MAG: Ig-like domain-containing protein [Clostridia bacterium]|nr:Ig-like domain-containing protein [Clostridia bacterium]